MIVSIANTRCGRMTETDKSLDRREKDVGKLITMMWENVGKLLSASLFCLLRLDGRIFSTLSILNED